MRVLFVSHYATPHIGGVETVIRSLRRELRRRGHVVRHVASNASHLSNEALGYDDEGVIRVRALNVLENRLGVPYPIFSPRLGRVLAREIAEADVVHAHGFLYMSSVLALLWATGAPPPRRPRARSDRARRARAVRVPAARPCRGHGDLEHGPHGRARGGCGGGAQPQGGRRDRGAGPREPVVVLPNGVDTTLFRPPLDGEREALRREFGWDDTPRVLFVGRLVAKKGIDAALAATAAAEGSFRLVVAGPGPLQPQGVPGVDVLGPIPSERVAELYRAADALLLPSRGEGFPVAVQEAMTSGLPVVMSDDPSYAPHLDGAGLGVRFVPACPESSPTSCGRSCRPRGLGGGRRGRAAHAQQAFAWSQAAERHELLYRELLASGSVERSRRVDVEAVESASNGAHSVASDSGAVQ